MAKKHQLTSKERRARMDAWFHRADEVLEQYGEPKEVKPHEEPPRDAA